MARTPGDTVRLYCVQCCGGKFTEVTTCDANKICLFYKYRSGKGRPSVKLLRKFCVDCMGGNRELVANCTTEDCIIHPYRFGKSVNRLEMSQEKKDAFIERVMAAREVKRTRSEKPIARTRTR